MHNPGAKRAFALLALLFLTSWSPRAQETPLPNFRTIAEEAPKALFQTEVGDADVDFFLSGSWDISTSLTTGFLIRPGEGVSRLDMFPGLLTGFDFTQVPDLTFSVWLAEHYFVEFSVLGSFDNNFFRMGYEGDGLLRHLYLGNRDIAIDPYAYLPVPEAGESSLGVEVELVSGESTHELLLRYDNNQEARIVFVGQNSVDERRVPISGYLTGRFFNLPDEDVDDLEVYIEDEDGSVLIDGSTFRLADLEDAELDAEGGFVTLKAPALGRVLVYYTKGVSQVGETPTGKIADELPPGTLIPGTAAPFVASSYTPDLRVPAGSTPPYKVLLWKPGAFSPFEILSSYDLGSNAPEELWRVDVKLVRRGGFTDDTPGGLSLDFQVDPVHDRVVASLNDDPRDLENLYPLISLDPFGDSLYGRYRDTSEGLFDHELLIQTLTPISSYSLGSDVLEGSVRVLRNGSEETRFTFDKASGTIQFHTPIAPTDRLEVTFAQRQSFVGNGDLLFVWGNRFPLRDPLSMEVAAGLRWNALPGAYSETAYSRTGGVLVSATLDGEYEQFRINARTAVSYAHPDTTGILRLAGMEKIGLELSVDENVAYPSSIPQVGTRDTRGQLHYKDYRDYGILDSFTLKGPEWSVPSDQIFPYTTGSRPGPYNVAAGSSERDKSLALDFSVGAGEWVGVQLPVVAGKGILDLSGMEALIASYRVYEMGAESVDLYFELGDIGEDLDDDGLLDAETSAASVGFGFRDYNAKIDLLVGGGPRMEGNQAIDTEDFDGNGVLDAEDPARVFRSLPETVSAGGWEVRRHPFTQTDREAIGRTRALRLVLHNNTGAATAGRILFDRLALAGSVYAPIAMSGTVVTVAEVREEFAAAPAPPLPLEKAHDVVADTFHAGGETQKVLEIDWTNPDGNSESWTVRGFTDTGTEGASYREIVHYMRLNGSGVNPGPTPATLKYQLLDAEGKGVTWSFTPTTFSDWREVRVNVEDKTVRVGGSIPTNALVTVDNHDSLIEFRIGFDNGADGSSGTLYVDELHLADPIGQLGMAMAVDAEVRFPGDLVTVGTLPIISDLTVREIVEASTPGFAGLYGRPTQVWTTASRTETSLGLLYAQLDTHLDIRGLDNRYTFGGGHRLVIPRIASPVVVEDSYNQSAHAEGTRFSRANKVTLRAISPLTLRATTAAQSTGKQLGQSWGSSATLAMDRTTTLLEGDLGLATTDYEHQDSEYFASWIKGYQFVLPQTAPLLERTGEFRWSLERKPEPVGINLWLEPGFRALPAGSARDHTAAVEYGVAIPIETERNLSITPRYVRRASITEPEQGQGSLQKDTALLFYRLWDQSYLYTQIPLWELYAPQTHEAFQDGSESVDDASYESDLGIEFSRRPASRVSFLYLPTRVDLGLGRTLEKDNDLHMSLYRVALSYQTNAINLFGRLGARPTFDFYAIDEVANTVSLTLHYRESGALHTGNLHVESLIGLEGEGGNLFTVTNRFELAGEDLQTASNQTNATYTWYVRPDGGVSLPILSDEITSEAFYSHEESLSVEVSDLQDGAGHPVTVLAGHLSRINLPGNGYLQASLNLGTDIESYLEANQDRERLTRVLIQAIVEAKIEF